MERQVWWKPEGGYKWEGDSRYPHDRIRLVPVNRPAAAQEVIIPATLYLTFSRIRANHESVIEFANQFGSLTGNDRSSTLLSWLKERAAIQAAINLWENKLRPTWQSVGRPGQPDHGLWRVQWRVEGSSR